MEVFKIIKVQSTHPYTYLLEDLSGNPILGSFYQYELLKTNYPDIYLVEKILKQRGKKSLVKFLGFKNLEWIPNENLL